MEGVGKQYRQTESILDQKHPKRLLKSSPPFHADLSRLLVVHFLSFRETD